MAPNKISEHLISKMEKLYGAIPKPVTRDGATRVLLMIRHGDPIGPIYYEFMRTDTRDLFTHVVSAGNSRRSECSYDRYIL